MERLRRLVAEKEKEKQNKNIRKEPPVQQNEVLKKFKESRKEPLTDDQIFDFKKLIDDSTLKILQENLQVIYEEKEISNLQIKLKEYSIKKQPLEMKKRDLLLQVNSIQNLLEEIAKEEQKYNQVIQQHINNIQNRKNQISQLQNHSDLLKLRIYENENKIQWEKELIEMNQMNDLSIQIDISEKKNQRLRSVKLSFENDLLSTLYDINGFLSVDMLSSGREPNKEMNIQLKIVKGKPKDQDDIIEIKDYINFEEYLSKNTKDKNERYFQTTLTKEDYQNNLEKNPDDIEMWIQYSMEQSKTDYMNGLSILVQSLSVGENRKNYELWKVYFDLYKSKMNSRFRLEDLRISYQSVIHFLPKQPIFHMEYYESEVKYDLKMNILDKAIQEFDQDSRMKTLFIFEKVRLYCLMNDVKLAIEYLDNINGSNFSHHHLNNLYLLLISLKHFQRFPVSQQGFYLFKYIDKPIMILFDSKGENIESDFEKYIRKFENLKHCIPILINLVEYKKIKSLKDAADICQYILTQESEILEIWYEFFLIFEDIDLDSSNESFLTLIKKYPDHHVLLIKYLLFLKRNYEEFSFPEKLSNEFKIQDQFYWLLHIFLNPNVETFKNALFYIRSDYKYIVWKEYFKFLEKENMNLFDSEMNEFIKMIEPKPYYHLPLVENSKNEILKKLIYVPKDYHLINQIYIEFQVINSNNIKGNIELITYFSQKCKSIALMKRGIKEFPNYLSLHCLLVKFETTEENIEKATKYVPMK